MSRYIFPSTYNRLLALTAVAILHTFPAQSQSVSLEWVAQFGGNSSGNDTGNDVAVDESGYVYTTGVFQSTADFNPGSGTHTFDGGGCFVSKLDANGNYVWARQLGDGSTDLLPDIGISIALDPEGAVYTTGTFQGVNDDFDPGPGTFPLSSAGIFPSTFVSKLDSDGNFVWAISLGGICNGNSIATDAAGNVYVAGYFRATVDFDPGAGVFELTSTGYEDAFIAKFDPNGTLIWAKQFKGNSGWDTGHIYGISVAPNGTIHATGRFIGTIDFNPNTIVSNLTTTGERDAFVMRLTTTGNLTWARQLGGETGDCTGYSVKTDQWGNVFVSGWFGGTVDFNPGAGVMNMDGHNLYQDAFICKLNLGGNFEWARQLKSTLGSWSAALDVDSDGYVYATGGFDGPTDFNPAGDSYFLNTINSAETFITKLDTDGDFEWARHFSSSNGGSRGNSIFVDPVGGIYTTGTFIRPTDFDPGEETFLLTTSGNDDVYVHKMSQGVSAVHEHSALQNGIRIHPNPASGLFTVQQIPEGSTMLRITGPDNRTVYSSSISGTQVEVNTADFTAGVYFVQVMGSKGIATGKLIVEK